MTTADIAGHRLANQGITKTVVTTAKEIVGWLGAVQAQDYAMAKWGVGLRLPGATDAVVEEALDRGEIIRTHILRPTWHFVSADDIRWMLDLSGPRVKAAIASWFRKLELDDALLRRTNRIIAKALSGGEHLTRSELMERLGKSGIRTDDLRSAHIMFGAELDGIICNGVRRGSQITYALLDERVSSAASLPRDESLARLALRYFTSHGPATVYDFSWWSGLTVTDTRRALEMVGSELEHETIDDRTYWFPEPSAKTTKKLRTINLLPAFDEFMVSYKERGASLDSAFTKAAITANGIFKPIIVRDGKVIGLWKRTLKKGKLLIEPSFFDPEETLSKDQLAAAAKPFGNYMELDVEITQRNSEGIQNYE